MVEKLVFHTFYHFSGLLSLLSLPGLDHLIELVQSVGSEASFSPKPGPPGATVEREGYLLTLTFLTSSPSND